MCRRSAAAASRSQLVGAPLRRRRPGRSLRRTPARAVSGSSDHGGGEVLAHRDVWRCRPGPGRGRPARAGVARSPVGADGRGLEPPPRPAAGATAGPAVSAIIAPAPWAGGDVAAAARPARLRRTGRGGAWRVEHPSSAR